MSESAGDRAVAPSPEQLRYATVLDIGMRTGLAILVAGYVLYVSGVLPPLVPFEELPRLWGLPVDEYVAKSGMATGWQWISLIDRGDVAVLIGIGLLAGISVPCLALLVPTYARGGDRPYLAISIALVAVLLLAVSGVLVA